MNSVPDKRGVSGQQPEKVGHLTRQIKNYTVNLRRPGRLASIAPPTFLADTLRLKVISNTEGDHVMQPMLRLIYMVY